MIRQKYGHVKQTEKGARGEEGRKRGLWDPGQPHPPMGGTRKSVLGPVLSSPDFGYKELKLHMKAICHLLPLSLNGPSPEEWGWGMDSLGKP